MIRLGALTLSRGGRELLREADAAIASGERIALIGLNGSGKTTLLSALEGDVLPDAGRIEQPFERVITLEQTLPSSDRPAWRHLLEADPELREAEQALEAATARAADPDSDRDGSRSVTGLALARAHADWIEARGADAPARARALLSGLGFSDSAAEAPVDSLSGGWRMRLNLARALFAPADLLLLDEPTNHLDLDAVLWLERWLVRSHCTMLIVSHDRDFLDRVVKACLHIDEGKLIRFTGGYSDFERQRAARAKQVTRNREAAKARVAHLESFIRRFRAQANRARQVQSRIKALERMAEVAPLRTLNSIDFDLAPVEDCPEQMLLAEDLSAGFGEQTIVRTRRLRIGRGARIGVLGRNGAGKSTLIRTLVGDLAPLSGSVVSPRGLRIGYFAQQGVDALRADESPLRHLQRTAPAEREQSLRDFLGRYGFRGDDAIRAVGPMSGGEKARLLLALLAWHRPQLLVLDEPTNHLDAQTRDALADALARFDGALLLVSHDRYLLRTSVDRFLIVVDGRVEDYDGDLDDYDAWTLARLDGPPATARASDGSRATVDRSEQGATASGAAVGARTDTAVAGHDRRTDRRLAAERRAALAQITRDIDTALRETESGLQTSAVELERIEATLQEPALYAVGADAEQIAALNRRRTLLTRDRDQLETRWLELQTEREERVASFETGRR